MPCLLVFDLFKINRNHTVLIFFVNRLDCHHLEDAGTRIFCCPSIHQFFLVLGPSLLLALPKSIPSLPSAKLLVVFQCSLPKLPCCQKCRRLPIQAKIRFQQGLSWGRKYMPPHRSELATFHDSLPESTSIKHSVF